MNSLIALLEPFDLTVNESKLYLTLLSHRTAKASDLARMTQIPRNKVYEIAARLHKKGFIEIVPEKVTLYRAVPFGAATELFIRGYEDRLKSIATTRERIEKELKTTLHEEKTEEGFFSVMRARRATKKRLEDIVSRAQNVFLFLGADDMKRFSGLARRARGSVKVLTTITRDNKEVVRKWLKTADVRHCEPETQVKIAIADNEIILSESSLALYSNDKKFVSLLRNFLLTSWFHASAAADTIEALETGKAVEEVLYLKGREDLYQRLPGFYANAREDVILTTTANGIVRLYKYLRPLIVETSQRGVRMRCLTKITAKNVDIVSEMLEYMDIRHAEKVHAVCGCYDTSLFVLIQIKDDTPRKESPHDAVIVTNKRDIVCAMRQMMEDSWEHGVDALLKIDELKTGKPIEEIRILRGSTEIYAMTRNIAVSAQKEICNIFGEASLQRAIKSGTLDEDRRAAARGVKVRYLIPVTAGNAALVRQAMAFAEVRDIRFPPIRVRVVDNRYSLARFGGEAVKEQVCVYSNIAAYVKNMKTYFEKSWEESVPAEEQLAGIERTERSAIPEPAAQIEAFASHLQALVSAAPKKKEAL